ncbi:hypothetical protein K431DRAFT_286692 [Polychaeton citri CBS 116435]|uniref:Uncharacterized protein n=1 Tax=Polychaeton citri CBS 116435 TaxID=1314669 RepID=A0A9P4Q6N4_9PEZI|nr:hypothetical protein K431DRAFT_286692 [Polychaeton citri CBS 116435]
MPIRRYHTAEAYSGASDGSAGGGGGGLGAAAHACQLPALPYTLSPHRIRQHARFGLLDGPLSCCSLFTTVSPNPTSRANNWP